MPGYLPPIVGQVTTLMENQEFVGQHKQGKMSFTRNRFFTFKMLVVFLMTNLQKSMQRELSLFKDAIELDGGSIPEVSKAAFSKARSKLKHTAFVELSNTVVREFYKIAAIQQWHGHRVIGIDGSTVVLPNSKDIISQYGVHSYRKDGKAICMGRTIMAYDTLNHMTLAGSLGKIEASETELLWKMLPQLDLNANDLLVFDRYFASHLLFFYLQHRGVQFCFRMKKDWWKVVEAFYNSGRNSQVLTLQLPSNDKKQATELGITNDILQCRLTRVELESGETEILLSSLVNEQTISVADTKELYSLRWNIEEAYKTFKHKVCIENFSGLSAESVLQDFYVKIFIMNLTAVAIIPINKALKKPAIKVKHTYQVNLIEAIATMKRAVVSFFITKQIAKALKRLYHRLLKTTEPVRPGRKFKRNHQPKRKHYKNYKPV